MVRLLDRHLLDLGGTYGRPEAGDPIQYDELRIEHDEGALEIVVYTGSPAAKRAPPPRAALFRS